MPHHHLPALTVLQCLLLTWSCTYTELFRVQGRHVCVTSTCPDVEHQPLPFHCINFTLCRE